MASAQAIGGSGLRLSGFGTIGVTHDDAPEGRDFRRATSQDARGPHLRADVDSRLGVQANYAPDTRLELVAQLTAMHRTPGARDDAPIEWAFVALRPDPAWALRLGRVNVDAFLMADYRNVGFGYLTARPPTEFYGVLPTSLDGGDVSRTWISGAAQWRAKVFAGATRMGDASAGRDSRVKAVLGTMVSREAEGLLVRASLARARIETDTARARPLLDALRALSALPVASVAAEAEDLREAIDLSAVNVRFADVGLRYERGPWQWSAELTAVSGHRSANWWAGYANVGRRVGDVVAYAGLSAIRPRGRAEPTPAWTAALTPLVGATAAAQAQTLGEVAASAGRVSMARQSTVTLGARWDLHPQAALKLQWDRTRIDNGMLLWGDAAPMGGHVDIGTVLVDFVF